MGHTSENIAIIRRFVLNLRKFGMAFHKRSAIALSPDPRQRAPC
jgi:hypothetical protein